jgi:uncharacterized ParB-like nuclease family protein
MKELQQTIDELNAHLKESGMARIAVVSPDVCYAQDLNARYMTPEMLDNLAHNIKADGTLESTPLVYEVDGGYKIVSGHHRIEAARKAGMKKIMVMITAIKDENQLRAKQLSHNSITGIDDKAVLAKLYNSIEDLTAKYYSGLQDSLEAISTTTLSFRVGILEEFVVAFMPEDIEKYDEFCKLVLESGKTSSSSIVRVVSGKNYDNFIKALIDTKKMRNIKQDAAAFATMIEMAHYRLKELIDSEKL